jgi:hypothetical protein
VALAEASVTNTGLLRRGRNVFGSVLFGLYEPIWGDIDDVILIGVNVHFVSKVSV